jgi:hypothetical protein
VDVLRPLDALRAILAIRAELTVSDRAVLMALVLHANNQDGAVWVSAPTLGRELALSVRTVEATRRRLASFGFIEIVQRRVGQSTVYRLRPDRIPACTPAIAAGVGRDGLRDPGNTTQRPRQGKVRNPGNGCRLSASDLHTETAHYERDRTLEGREAPRKENGMETESACPTSRPRVNPESPPTVVREVPRELTASEFAERRRESIEELANLGAQWEREARDKRAAGGND